MRTFFILLVLCLFTTTISYGQEEDLSLLISNYSENFIGTWKYESENYSIQITFTKGIVGNFEHIFGTYKVQKNGLQFEDSDEKNIMGFPKRFNYDEIDSKFNSNEIVFHIVDRKYFKGSNEFAISRFTLTIQNGYTDRAVWVQVADEDPNTFVDRKRLRPTEKIFPPDGTVLIKQR